MYNVLQCNVAWLYSTQLFRTSFEETRWLSSLRTSSCEDNQTGSCVIDNWDFSQSRSKLGSTSICWSFKRLFAYNRLTLTIYDHALQLVFGPMSEWLPQTMTMMSLKSLTSLLCASCRYLDDEGNIFTSWGTYVITTFHMSSTGWTKYAVQWLSRRRPNGTRLPRLRPSSTSCTLTQCAFLSPKNCLSRGAKSTEVSLATGPTYLSRGGGYEYDEYCYATIHCMTFNMYSLLIWSVLFHRKDVLRVYVAIAISEGNVLYNAPSTSRYVQWRTINLTSYTTRCMISRDKRAASLVCLDHYESPSTWHEDHARTYAS
jgi:hypothetical protein